MRKIVLIVIMALGLGTVPMSMAQNHGEVGAFTDYLRLTPFDTNNVGVGGRAGFNVHPNIQLEAELSYDFARSFDETITSGGGIFINRTKLRIIHGEFGPKFQTGGQAIRAFFVLKGGFANFSFSNRAATFGNFTSQFGNLTEDNSHPVFYPGGGLEFYAGIIGVRLDVGDEMYFSSGTHNNLRVALGPSIRF